MQLRVIHTTCTLKKLFPYNDKQPHLQQFHIIYQLKCDCGASYIGQTGRNLINRLNNHNIDSPYLSAVDKFAYADDLALLHSSGNWKDLEETLSQNMSTLSAYLQTWRLKLSYTKTVTAAFHLNNR